MSEHLNYIVGFDYTIDSLVDKLASLPFEAGHFLIDLGTDLKRQADGDKLRKRYKLSNNLQLASIYLYLAGQSIELFELGKFSDFQLENDVELVSAVGNMTYDKVSEFVHTFNQKMTPFLLKNNFVHVIGRLNLSKHYLDNAWTICRPYASIVEKPF